jgi:hypothetical protein
MYWALIDDGLIKNSGCCDFNSVVAGHNVDNLAHSSSSTGGVVDGLHGDGGVAGDQVCCGGVVLEYAPLDNHLTIAVKYVLTMKFPEWFCRFKF